MILISLRNSLFLQSQFNTSLLIGIDQEGGQVNRLKNIDEYKDFESWAEIGKINEPLKTSSFAKRTAEALKLHGINLNFAPVLDLEMNPLSIIAKKKDAYQKILQIPLITQNSLSMNIDRSE